MSVRLIKYTEGDSVVHRLDPRAKLTFLFSILIALILTASLPLIIPLLAISLTFYLSARLPWDKTKSTWKFTVVIILVLSALNYLTISVLYGGEGVNLLQKLTSQEIILKSITPVCKLLTLVIATATFVFTTPPNLYAPALGQVRLPYKIAYIIQLALRYVPEYIAEMSKTLEAQMARGYRPRGGKNPIARILSVVPLLVPVTISATISIYDIADAMELRGFGEEKCHTWYRSLVMKRGDRLLMIVSTLLIVAYTIQYAILLLT
ncbi:MAG: energy-coupling factor transporter transmembrane protein EcfT [Candidatus Korarchaeota archaeon]|nr:energy-coupling factor transporter transmembrane protein EcfT [Candidatus Korarchaeota archaeon]